MDGHVLSPLCTEDGVPEEKHSGPNRGAVERTRQVHALAEVTVDGIGHRAFGAIQRVKCGNRDRWFKKRHVYPHLLQLTARQHRAATRIGLVVQLRLT